MCIRDSVGPGRGSGAGSIVAYSLRITDLDPIPNFLLFERCLLYTSDAADERSSVDLGGRRILKKKKKDKKKKKKKNNKINVCNKRSN